MNDGIHYSFKCAVEGIIRAFQDNRNMKIHLGVGLLVILASFILGLNKLEKVILLLTILLVLSSEMINTSIEEMTDLITSEHKAEAKIAKDVAAGMVLVTAGGAVIIGMAIFVPYILHLF